MFCYFQWSFSTIEQFLVDRPRRNFSLFRLDQFVFSTTTSDHQFAKSWISLTEKHHEANRWKMFLILETPPFTTFITSRSAIASVRCQVRKCINVCHRCQSIFWAGQLHNCAQRVPVPRYICVNLHLTLPECHRACIYTSMYYYYYHDDVPTYRVTRLGVPVGKRPSVNDLEWMFKYTKLLLKESIFFFFLIRFNRSRPHYIFMIKCVFSSINQLVKIIIKHFYSYKITRYTSHYGNINASRSNYWS